MIIHDHIIAIGTRLVSESESLRDAFWNLYENDDAFLGKDLDGEDWASLLKVEEIDTLKQFQCGRIRQLRAKAYTEEFDGLAAGVAWDGDNDIAARAKREEIKNRYPYPGKYRYKAEGVE